MTTDRDRIKREIGYGTGGIAEKMRNVELVVTHKVPEKDKQEEKENEQNSDAVV